MYNYDLEPMRAKGRYDTCTCISSDVTCISSDVLVMIHAHVSVVMSHVSVVMSRGEQDLLVCSLLQRPWK